MILDYYKELHHYYQSLIILALSIIAGFLIRFFLIKVARALSKKSDDIVIDSIYKRTKGAWFLFIPLFIFLFLFPRGAFEEKELSTIIKITQTLIILSFATIGIRAVNVIQDVLFDRYDIAKQDNVKERKMRTQVSFIKKLLIIAIVTITLAAVLLNIEGVRKYGAALVTSAGVAGIIIGFAAQKTLANLLAGIQIAFTQPIKIDDVVIVENEWGWIEEINLTYVVVKIWDWRRLIVPITYFVEKPFQNWTRTTADLLGSVYLYVDYSVPLEELRKEFDRVLDSTEMWDKNAKVLQVVESTEKCMQIRMLMSARSSPIAWDLRCLVREKMIDYIQKNYPESLPRLRAEVSGSKISSTEEDQVKK